MASSITVSFGGGFVFSSAEEAGAASTCIGWASVGVASLVVSDGALAFWVFAPAAGGGAVGFWVFAAAAGGGAVAFWVFAPAAGGAAVGTCEGPTSSATSFWCWLEEVLEVGDGGSSVSGCAVAGWRLGVEGGGRTLALGCCGCDFSFFESNKLFSKKSKKKKMTE